MRRPGWLRHRGAAARAGETAQAARNVMCCPHCSDSKFPCARMEKQLAGGARQRDRK